MRRFIAIGAVVGLAVFVFAQMSGSDLLKSYSTALNGAKSLSTTFSVQKIGGTSTTYSVDLAKPNKARIDTPTQLIVADGTNITTYTKKDNSYFKQPETDADLKALFAGDELSLFAPFFDQSYFANKVVASKAGAQKVLKGTAYNVVAANMDNKGKKTVTFYLDPKDNIAKRGEYTLVDAGATDTLLVMTKEFALDNTQGASTFAFSAPDGAHEITAEEMSADKWYTNLDEAAAVAKRLNKPMFVDFYADW